MTSPASRRILQEIARILGVILGATISALGYSLFQVPYNIAAGGVSGLAIVINHFTGWPVGLMILVMNAPLMILGYLHLGGWRFVLRTLVGVAAFAAGTDILLAVLPRLLADLPITQDVLLSALYAGIIGGIGVGVVYRAGSSMGGTGILGRILQLKTGAPLSQVYFYTDGVIILIAALVFGWETGLYALLTLFVSGLASDYTLEGPSSVRTATIVTDEPERVSQALIAELGRGVSRWEITGAYTGERHAMIMCAVYRPQVADVKRVVAEADRDAFVVIGMAHQALGYGFAPLKNPGPS